MVGFDRSSNSKLTNFDFITAGAVSGVITRTLFQPLDVIKIRCQLQIEPIKRSSTNSKYKGMTHAFISVFREEGVLALWKGFIPAQLLSISYGAFQFVSYEVLTYQCRTYLPENVQTKAKPVINFACGALAGCIAQTGSLPFDVLRTRLVAQGEPKIYRSMTQATYTMLHKEGLRSFYKGFIPTVLQIMPNTGAQFAFYQLFKDLWNFTVKKDSTEHSIAQNTCCGAAAGIGAKTFVYPLDLVKKRIQVQGFEAARKPFGAVGLYTGFIHCIASIFREEGFLAFYKGLWPSVLKAAFTTASHFVFYEETLKVIVHFKN